MCKENFVVQIKLWFGFCIYWILSIQLLQPIQSRGKQQTRKMIDIKSPKGAVRQVNSSSAIFLTRHQNIWCMDDPCLWSSQVMESSGDNTTTFYTLEVPNSGSLASCSREKGLQNFNTALPVHCRIRISYLQPIIWMCKQKEGRGIFKRHVQLDHVSPQQ